MATGQLQPLIHYLRRAAEPAPADATDAELLARFAACRDEAAFAALVRRHGGLVLGVCRRVLGDLHAAQDAMQATFLVLARKAGSLRRPASLGPWLHGVARRTAWKARAEAASRRAREGRAARAEAVAPDEDLLWRDLRAVLDQEVGRLPARHRSAVVLCYLQGRTNAEAARELGCSRGTVATLLARARERLRGRLARRGLAPAALALALAGRAQAAPLPAALASSTARAATAFAAGPVPAVGAVSARAASLAEGVTRAMLLKKVLTGTAAVLLLGLAATGAGLATRPGDARGAAVAPDEADVGTPAAAPTLPPAPAPEPEDGPPATHRTANFVVKAPTAAVARQVGQAAERHRKALALRWLGKELPDWPEPCLVRVNLTPTDRGHGAHATAFVFRPDGTVERQDMILKGPLAAILADMLPHEVTHTVLAHWAGRPLPRWADEGAAQMAESAAARVRHEASLAKVLAEGRELPLRRLLPMAEYPRDVPVLYAQGYSLTEFLVGARGRARFLAFVAQGQTDGWDEAARDQYGYRGVDDLERAWRAAIRGGGAGPVPVVRPSQPIEPPPPLPSERLAPPPPVLRLYEPRLRGPGKLLITWEASGPGLDERPIILSYAETSEGPWQPIASTANTGRFEWDVPPDVPAHVLVRLEATSRDGSAATVQTRARVRDAGDEPTPRDPRAHLPAGPAPVQVLAELLGPKRLRVWRLVAFYQPVTSVDAGGHTVTGYRMRTTHMPTVYSLDRVRVQDTKGKAVSAKEVARLLKGTTPVLASTDGRPVDPLHLRLVKEGTLVLVLPPPPAVPAPPAAYPPAPAAPPAAVTPAYPPLGRYEPVPTGPPAPAVEPPVIYPPAGPAGPAYPPAPVPQGY